MDASSLNIVSERILAMLSGQMYSTLSAVVDCIVKKISAEAAEKNERENSCHPNTPRQRRTVSRVNLRVTKRT
jgi:hypothetical protein